MSFQMRQVPVRLGKMPAQPPLTHPVRLWVKVGICLAFQLCM